ncbi:Putative E3 ubiquitin-protein ligase LIN [Seminavis robusta]|uniref:E3 ubiquitin-protein ligase LIN n=1 Tax=Seminavis robusta TaxID=568900 RepID=A0A9N8EJ50_9STRA|nr:Putative E3 ubiquitin-protein ligase LIN [Seminavis robusta]|eukprot:Sro1039_g234350.1 Putative E3 ubiquitin-protein ligase LIN (260) ;mRNA; f:3730-4509
MPEAIATTSASSLSLGQLLNARQNLTTIDKALSQIQQLLEQKESLEAEIVALKREKSKLTYEVVSLRNECDDDSSRKASSLPDLGIAFGGDDDSSSYDSDDSDEEMTNSERKAKAPEHFICPLTLEIMKHPMQQKGTQNNYERGAILEWIYFGKATCPMTRRVLHPGDFVENTVLEREIESWREKYGVLDESADDDEDNGDPIPTLTPEEEEMQQQRLQVVQVKRVGSHNELMGLRDRVLRKQAARARRRMSTHGGLRV